MARDDVFTVDFPDDMGDGGGNRIPAGNHYIGKCVGVVKSTAKSSGNEMLTWSFVITKGEYAGRDFVLYTALTKPAMWKVGETLRALGIEYEEGARLKFAASDARGVLVRLVIEDDEYNGREQSKLAGILPHPDGAGKKGGKAALVPDDEEEEEEEEEHEDDEELEEEEEEEEEKPRKKAKKTAKPPKRGGRASSRL